MQLAMKDNSNHMVRPNNIIEEVKGIVFLMFPQFDFHKVASVYHDIIKLFRGEFCGYYKCNTKYHDLCHTKDCLLLTARLFHGAFLNGHKFSERSINLGLISAIMHDTGYIQSANDINGTGGKYTVVHIERSIDFVRKYFDIKGYPSEDFSFVRGCLYCTGLNVALRDIHFESVEHELVGRILGTADLIGQMSDSNYLEKLLFLFDEFQEGGIKDYKTELDLLLKTPAFWEFTKMRFATELGNVDNYLRDHFRVRWGVDRDLDREAIEKNIHRLQYILKSHATDYRKYLRN